jgi:hypothetical protein
MFIKGLQEKVCKPMISKKTVKSLRESTKTADGREAHLRMTKEKKEKKNEERKSDRLANKGKGEFR